MLLKLLAQQLILELCSQIHLEPSIKVYYNVHAHQYTCAAKYTRILANDVNEMCSYLSLGTIASPVPLPASCS